MPDLLVTATGAGSWVVPADVHQVTAELTGGGGEGGGIFQGTSGAAGQDTTFGTLTAQRGRGGHTEANYAPGAGGVASGGDVNINGEPGQQAQDNALAARAGGRSGARGIVGLDGRGDGGDGEWTGSGTSGPGAGGGAYVRVNAYAVTPGETIAYFVGAGGSGRPGGDGADGALRLTWAPNVSPSVALATPAQGVLAGAVVALAATTNDADGMIVGFAWTADGGSFDDPAIEDATWTAPNAADVRTYTLRLTVRDNHGATAFAEVMITVTPILPAVSALIPAPAPRFPVIDVAARVNLLLPQYASAANLQALARELIAVVQDEIIDPLVVMERALNPDESEGILLDWIGQRLGLPRPFVTTADATYFGFEGTRAAGGRTFGQAPFFTRRSSIEQIEPVGDRVYRLLLKGRARRLRGGANRETIEAVLAIVFGNGHLDESTDPIELVVSTDDDVLYGLVSGSEFERIIPRPAGRAMTMRRA